MSCEVRRADLVAVEQTGDRFPLRVAGNPKRRVDLVVGVELPIEVDETEDDTGDEGNGRRSGGKY